MVGLIFCSIWESELSRAACKNGQIAADHRGRPYRLTGLAFDGFGPAESDEQFHPALREIRVGRDSRDPVDRRERTL
jgi:hypothetical protein